MKIRRAFTSRFDLVVFFCLLLFILIFPLMGFLGFPKKTLLYKSSSDWALQSGINYYINENHDDIDVLILGFSSIWVGVDASLLEERLSETLGRKSKVIMLATNHPGEGILRTFYEDVVRNRKVKLVLVATPSRSSEAPHPYVSHILQIPQNLFMFENSTFKNQVKYYSLMMLRSFQRLLLLPRQVTLQTHEMDLSHNGSYLRPVLWGGKIKYKEEPTTRLNIHSKSQILPAYKKTSFLLKNEISQFQTNHLIELRNRSLEMGSGFGFVYVPLYDERTEPSIVMRVDMRKFGVSQPPIFGVSNEALFAGQSDEQIQTFFYNQNHMNSHAAVQFTGLIAGEISEYFNEHIEKK